MNSSGVCPITFEASINSAIEMLDEVFSQYVDALYRVEKKQAKMILHDEGEATLKRKHSLEIALLNGKMASGVLSQNVPSMNLDYVLHQKSLAPDSDVREVVAFAIHLEKIAEDYFLQMCETCARSSMLPLFKQLLEEQKKRLLSLEDLYEQHFMTEN